MVQADSQIDSITSQLIMKPETRLRIAHISDVHISPDAALQGGIDTRKNLAAVFGNLEGKEIDIIVFGGDLAADRGEVESYQWISEHLDQLQLSYLIVLGNHDIKRNVQETFNVESVLEDELVFHKKLKGVNLIGLDSSKKKVSEDQLEWLLSIQSSLEGPVLLFIHHPPVFCDCDFMDAKHSLENREKVMAIIQKIPNLKGVFCGHYHTEKTVLTSTSRVFITPSTVLQASQIGIEFKEASRLPGWRQIDMDDSGLRTCVHYLSS